VPASAVSSSARLVIDFDPGTVTVARTGSRATGAAHGSWVDVVTAPSLRIRSRTAEARAGRRLSTAVDKSAVS
jgi:hypothetical protein